MYEENLIEKVTERVLSRIGELLNAKLVNEPEVLTPKQAALHTGLKQSYIHNLVKTNRVQGRAQKPFLVNMKSLRDFLAV